METVEYLKNKAINKKKCFRQKLYEVVWRIIIKSIFEKKSLFQGHGKITIIAIFLNIVELYDFF